MNVSQDTCQTYTIHNASALESYIQERSKELHVHVAARVGGNSVAIQHLCLAFYKTTIDIHGAGEDDCVSFCAKSIHVHNHRGRMTVGHDQESVLVDVREFVKHPEGIGSKVLPSVIRLQALDDCLRSWMNSANLVEPVTFKHVGSGTEHALRIFVPEDRELTALYDIIGKRAGIFEGKRVNQVVETSSEVVKNVADQKCERIGGNVLNGYSDTEVIGSFRVSMTAERVMVTVQPLKDVFLQVIQVTMRPRKFQKVIATSRHDEVKSDYGEKTKNAEGHRHPHPEARRLLQESEEIRHAVSVSPSEEVTSQTAPVRLSGDCTATHTRSNNPEDVS